MNKFAMVEFTSELLVTRIATYKIEASNFESKVLSMGIFEENIDLNDSNSSKRGWCRFFPD